MTTAHAHSDELPELSEAFALRESDVVGFRERGHATIRALATPDEVALDHPTRRFDRDVWLTGCEPGEPAAGPRNPVLYSRAGSV